MKKAIIFILILCSGASAFDGADFMLNADLYNPLNGGFSFYSDCHNNSMSAVFRNARLYDIKELDWSFIGARAGLAGNNLTICFRDYGVNKLYGSTVFSLALDRQLTAGLTAGLGYTRQAIEYGDGLVNQNYNLFCLKAGYRVTQVAFGASINNLSFSTRDYNNDPELTFSVGWQADEILNIFSVYHTDRNGHARFTLGQFLQLNDYVRINLGLLNSPEVYYAGFEVVYNRFVFGYTIFDIGGLPDCSLITLSYRR